MIKREPTENELKAARAMSIAVIETILSAAYLATGTRRSDHRKIRVEVPNEKQTRAVA